MKIYLDDIRTPIDSSFVVVRNYDEFVKLVEQVGLDGIDLISLDHDLGRTAEREYVEHGSKEYNINYDNIEEKTGYDAAKWLVDKFYEVNPDRIDMHRSIKKTSPIVFPDVVVHSANPIGSANIIGYINNFYRNESKPQDCVRVRIPHTVDDNIFPVIANDIATTFGNLPYDRGDLADIGNEIGIIVGKYVNTEMGFDLQSFIAGVHHGFDLAKYHERETIN